MAMRLRNIMVDGLMKGSPSEIVGNSNGNPPAAQTPLLTASATCRKCALQFASSDYELQIPITGFPSKTLPGKPSARIQERWMRPSLSFLPNHSCERSFIEPLVIGGHYRQGSTLPNYSTNSQAPIFLYSVNLLI